MKKRRYKWLALFLIISWVSTALVWNGMSSVIPAIVTTIAAYSFWQKSVRVTRTLALGIAVLMFIYDIFVHSYAGLVNESLTIISVAIALIRYREKVNDAAVENR